MRLLACFIVESKSYSDGLFQFLDIQFPKTMVSDVLAEKTSSWMQEKISPLFLPVSPPLDLALKKYLLSKCSNFIQN